MLFFLLLTSNETGLASLLSVIISTVIGLITAFITTHKAKMNFYSSTVSKERVEWINQTREITSKLVAFCSMHTETQLSPEDVASFEFLRSSLLVRITPMKESENIKYCDDKILIELLNTAYEKVRENRYKIRDIVTVICKKEWDRIKAEAGGNKNLEKLIKKYDASVKKEYKRPRN